MENKILESVKSNTTSQAFSKTVNLAHYLFLHHPQICADVFTKQFILEVVDKYIDPVEIDLSFIQRRLAMWDKNEESNDQA